MAESDLNFLALGILASYFVLIGGLFTLILSSLGGIASQPVLKTHTTISKWSTLFLLLATLSFAHTWYYMFAFLKSSFEGFEAQWPSAVLAELTTLKRVSNWLDKTALFEQAWAVVCSTPLNWWWSEQLCLYTVGAWTVFLFTQSRRYDIPYAWAYMILGQVVAVSVASNLFFAAVILHSSRKPATSLVEPKVSLWTTWAPLGVALATVWNTPSYSGTPHFLSNLLTMHVLLIVPLLAPKSTAVFSKGEEQTFLGSSSTLYLAIGLASLVVRGRTLQNLFPSLSLSELFASVPREAYLGKLKAFGIDVYETLYSHPAQSSIGFDVVWASASYLAWELFWRKTQPLKRSTYSSSGHAAFKASTLGWGTALLEVANESVAVLVASVGVGAPLRWMGRRRVEGDVEASSKTE